jgi:hypothetical protein
MQDKEKIKRLKLVAIVLIVTLAFFLELQKSVPAAQDQVTRLFEIVGMNVPLEKRFGVDDGASFVVHFSGDTQGSLDACG